MDYYTLDRKKVSEMLKISTRTLDRYVAKNLFSTIKKKGKLFFHQKEIEDYIKEQNTESIDISSDTQKERLRHIKDAFFEQQENNSVVENMSKTASEIVFKHIETPKYLELKEKFQNELHVKNELNNSLQKQNQDLVEKLQNAYYQLGQAENKAKQIPLSLDQEKKSLQETKKALQEQILEEKEKEIQRNEEINKLYFLKFFYSFVTVSVIIAFSFFLALY